MLFGLESMLRVMHKVASGTKFTIFVLMEVPAHLLAEGGLVQH
jgi:hypothetical protein